MFHHRGFIPALICFIVLFIPLTWQAWLELVPPSGAQIPFLSYLIFACLYLILFTGCILLGIGLSRRHKILLTASILFLVVDAAVVAVLVTIRYLLTRNF